MEALPFQAELAQGIEEWVIGWYFPCTHALRGHGLRTLPRPGFSLVPTLCVGTTLLRDHLSIREFQLLNIVPE